MNDYHCNLEDVVIICNLVKDAINLLLYTTQFTNNVIKFKDRKKEEEE